MCNGIVSLYLTEAVWMVDALVALGESGDGDSRPQPRHSGHSLDKLGLLLDDVILGVLVAKGQVLGPAGLQRVGRMVGHQIRTSLVQVGQEEGAEVGELCPQGNDHSCHGKSRLRLG